MIANESSTLTRKQRSDKLPDSYKVRKRRTYPFIAWDGEGYTLNGTHHYGLFGSSEGARVVGSSLDYSDCLPLILDSPKQAIHVIYAGTYDVTMMFRDTAQRNSIGAGQWVAVGRYRLRFLKGKMLTVKDSVTGESRTLYDVFSFFGTSFVKACREYLSLDTPLHDSTVGEVLEHVEAMKLQRADFTSVTADVKTYMATELELLVMLCDALRERLAAVGIHPSKWHGPGAIASAVLKDQHVNRYRKKDTHPLVVRAAECAYYGGRFEMFKRGTHIGPVYQYDIRSAYPNAMTQLPGINCEWTHYERERIKHDYGLYLVRIRDLERSVPFRDEYGTIYFPDWCYGWYWGVELPKGVIAQEAYIPNLTSDHKPFAFVRTMYDDRARLKREGKPEQLALKLALNSLYGKLAQSKGANWDGKAWRKPTYHEALWAGYITAYTRAMIQEAIALAGPNIIAAETDAVFSTVPLPLDIGTGLGQWECTEYDGIKYIQSGVHLTLKNGEWSFKTRGFTMRKNSTDVDMLDDLLTKGYVFIDQVRFGTDPRSKHYGKWYRQRRKMVLDHPMTQEKRINVGRCNSCNDHAQPTDYSTHLHSLVVPPLIERQSIPYHFTWGQKPPPLDPTIDDPTLFLEYDPLSLNA